MHHQTIEKIIGLSILYSRFLSSCEVNRGQCVVTTRFSQYLLVLYKSPQANNLQLLQFRR